MPPDAGGPTDVITIWSHVVQCYIPIPELFAKQTITHNEQKSHSSHTDVKFKITFCLPNIRKPIWIEMKAWSTSACS